MPKLKLAVIDVKPGAALESQSGLQMMRPRIYGAWMAPPGPKKVAAIVMHHLASREAAPTSELSRKPK